MFNFQRISVDMILKRLRTSFTYFPTVFHTCYIYLLPTPAHTPRYVPK